MEPNLQAPPWRGNIFAGILLGIGCQIATIVLSLLMMMSGNQNLALSIVFWGITQYLLVLPLRAVLLKRGQHRTAKGLLIMSFIGLLLCSLCGALFFIPSNWQPRLAG